jgi:hypothetical protein
MRHDDRAEPAHLRARQVGRASAAAVADLEARSLDRAVSPGAIRMACGWRPIPPVAHVHVEPWDALQPDAHEPLLDRARALL